MSLANLISEPNEQTTCESLHPDVVTVDLEVLSDLGGSNSPGEADFAVELIDIFLDQTPLLIKSIHENLASQDLSAAKHAAHGLRGSSNNLGILRMGAIAEDLEYCSPDETIFRSLLKHLEEEFLEVEKILLAERHRRTL